MAVLGLTPTSINLEEHTTCRLNLVDMLMQVMIMVVIVIVIVIRMVVGGGEALVGTGRDCELH